MGYRELLLVLMGIGLFSLLTTQTNVNMANGREAMQEVEIQHLAVSVARQFIEEARAKQYDAVLSFLDEDDITDPSVFTGSLGHGGHESYPNFNDVDDFHNFNQTIYVQGIDFQVSIEVIYINDSDPTSPAGTKTYFKKMAVTVNSGYLPGSITFKQVFSYFGVG